MSLLAAQEYLSTLLGALAITQPVASSIKRVYSPVPQAGQAIPDADLPCWLTALEVSEVTFPQSGVIVLARFRLELLVGRAERELDLKARMAASYIDSLIDAVSADDTLGGTVTQVRSIGTAGGDTVMSIEHGGIAYVGAELWLEFASRRE